MSPRAKIEKPLIARVAAAFDSVEKLQRRGKNRTRRYPFTRASDVLEAVRHKLLGQGIIIHLSEGAPAYERNVTQTNGGESITECNLAVTYTFMSAKEELKPMTVNGVGRDVEDKSLYKAQTGAQKALLKRFGLIAEETDDPECDSQGEADEHNPFDEARPTRIPKKVTDRQIACFDEACAAAGKSADEVSGYLLTEHKVASIAELGRGKPFTQAIVWASDGAGTLAPKPQAAPALQGSLGLKAAPQPIEMKIGNKAVSFQPSDRATFSV